MHPLHPGIPFAAAVYCQAHSLCSIAAKVSAAAVCCGECAPKAQSMQSKQLILTFCCLQATTALGLTSAVSLTSTLAGHLQATCTAGVLTAAAQVGCALPPDGMQCMSMQASAQHFRNTGSSSHGMQHSQGNSAGDSSSSSRGEHSLPRRA